MRRSSTTFLAAVLVAVAIAGVLAPPPARAQGPDLKNDPSVWFYWGKSAEQHDKHAEAVDDYDSCIAIIERKAQAGEKVTNDHVRYFFEGIERGADCCRKLGRHADARKRLEKGIALARKMAPGRDETLGKLLARLGEVHLAEGAYDRALERLEESLAIAQRLKKDDQAKAREAAIARVYESWGSMDRALEHAAKAAEVDGLAPWDRAERRSHLAELHARAGNLEKARELYALALEEDLKTLDLSDVDPKFRDLYQAWGWQKGAPAAVARDAAGLGSIVLQIGDAAKAGEHLAKAIEFARKVDEPGRLAAALGWSSLQKERAGKRGEAIREAGEALRIARKIGEPPAIALHLDHLGLFRLRGGTPAEALDPLREAVALKEKLRETASGVQRRDYLASQIATYRMLVEALVRERAFDEAFAATEASSARLLAERLAGSAAPPEVTAAEVRAALAEDAAVVVFAPAGYEARDLACLVLTRERTEGRLVETAPLCAALAAAQRDGVAAFAGRRRGFEAELKKAKKSGVTLAGGTAVPQVSFDLAIEYFRKVLTTAGPGGLDRVKVAARPFYDALLAPIEPLLAGKKRLVVVPGGTLAFLPLEALVDGEGRPVAARFAIGYVPSLAVALFTAERRHPARSKTLLALGGAVYDPEAYRAEMVTPSADLDEGFLAHRLAKAAERGASTRGIYAGAGRIAWKNLPGTLAEVQAIANAAEGVDVLAGDRVAEDVVREMSKKGELKAYRMLHFATHGLADPEIPDLSAIVLSQLKEERGGHDGYLRMDEIAGLGLAADFVGLSACETGLGAIYGGEGVVGLTQSFLVAGANSLAVSLWQVADESTARLMTAFYEAVLKHGKTPADALAEVKAGFARGDAGETWKHPYFWAPFVFYGAGDALSPEAARASPTPRWAAATGIDRFGPWADLRVKGAAVRLRLCPPGKFVMGAEKADGGGDEGPPHEVTLTRGFWIGEAECPQPLYEAVTGANPSDPKMEDGPVNRVSWDECRAFLAALGKHVRGAQPRLPTEAEWEYACRAGATGKFDPPGGPDAVAWHKGNAGGKAHPSKRKRPNSWGLHDMHGNLVEWCSDLFAPLGRAAATDPSGAKDGQARVLKGGAGNMEADMCAAPVRPRAPPPTRGPIPGFRFVIPADATREAVAAAIRAAIPPVVGHRRVGFLSDALGAALFVAEEGSKAAEAWRAVGPAGMTPCVMRPGAGPAGAAMVAPDEATIDRYLAALPEAQVSLQVLVDAAPDGATLELPRARFLERAGVEIEERRGLTISAAPGAQLVCEDEGDDVIAVRDSERIAIRGLVCGHVPAAEGCGGDVVSVWKSRAVQVLDCELYGCGVTGVTVAKSEDVAVEGCFVHDNSSAAFAVRDSKGVRIAGCRVERNEAVWYGAGGKVPPGVTYERNAEKENPPPEKK